MKVTSVEKKEKSTVELTIQIDAAQFEAAVQKAYLKSRGSISVPGFRKGKAPRKIIEGMYGAGVFYEDAINDVYPSAYEEAVKEQGLDDVGYPKMEIVEVGKEGFTFKALVSVRPEVKLGTYKGITAPKEEPKITEKDVDEEMKDLDISFPEDYHADLAGKAVVFHVKVNEVKESQAPAVDDEFAKDVSEFETLEAFRADLKEKVTQRRQQQAQADFENAVMDQLVEDMECEIPDGMVEVQVDRLMDDYAMRLQGQGISMDDYMKMMGMSPEMLRTSARPAALKQVQTELALTAVADAEKLEVTEEELEAEFSRLAEQYGLKVEQVTAAVPAEDLKKDLRLKKASSLVIAEAKAGKAKKKAAAKKTEAAEAAAEEAPAEEKPKRAHKKKTEEPKAE